MEWKVPSGRWTTSIVLHLWPRVVFFKCIYDRKNHCPRQKFMLNSFEIIWTSSHEMVCTFICITAKLMWESLKQLYLDPRVSSDGLIHLASDIHIKVFHCQKKYLHLVLQKKNSLSMQISSEYLNMLCRNSSYFPMTTSFFPFPCQGTKFVFRG